MSVFTLSNNHVCITNMPAIPATSDLLELKLSEWNDVVSDETQCMRIAPAEEVKFLSSQNKNRKCFLGRMLINAID